MNTFESIAAAIGGALEPLIVTLSSPQRAQRLIRALGWELPPGVSDIGLSRLDVAGLLDKVTDLRAAGKFEGSDSGITAGISADLLVTVQAFLRELNGFANGLGAIASGDYLTRTRIREEFPRRLLDYLFVQELRLGAGPLLTLLSLTGIVRFEPHSADPANFVSDHVRHIVAYDRIGPLVADTGGQLRQFFDWGTPQFDSGRLLLFMGFFLQAIGGRATLRPLARDVEERLAGRSIPEADTAPLSHLIVSMRRGSILDGVDLGLVVLGLRPASSGGSDGGFAFSPFARGTAERTLNVRENLTLDLDSTLDLVQGTVASFRPGQSLKIQTGVAGNDPVGSATQGRMALRTHYPGQDSTPMNLLVIPGGTYLNAKELTLAFGVDTKGPGPSPFVEIGLNRLHFHMAGVGSDGFLANVLPASLDADFGLVAGWSGDGGMYFQGSSALQIQLASHISLGPIEIVSLTLEVGIDGGKFAVTISSSIKGSLGPLTALVEGVGVEVGLKLLGDNSGNLGPIDLTPGLKALTGVGLSLDAGIISGGGFLLFDSAHGEYAGALELIFAGFLGLHAVGLISTRMPDGSKGFSLLIIITADFGPGIQLGFGFTLLAVGGLLGLNRAMLFQPLMDGIRTGAIESVMFPHDVVANAMRIISDLRAIFPPQQAVFLIGPMAKLGWGEPTLISLALGIIIEIPPGDIVILGILKLALPAEELAVLVIQVNFAGALEFDKKRFYFFASLFDSHVLFITIEGEMGVLMAFGDDANFVLSVGGFHPQFVPPPLPFPSPRRIEVDIINESFARIRCTGYFAVTSNSCQFGSSSEYFFGFSALSVEGHSGFDALLQFSPFHFSVSISTSFCVKVFGLGVYGIGIDLTLEGPTPWHARGTASLSFFFFSVDIGIEFSWGDSRNTTLPPVALMPVLAGELAKQSNWRAILPAGSSLLVSLRKLDPAESELVLHPVGTLQVSQRAIPLDLMLDKAGNQAPNDANRFELTVSSAELTAVRKLQERFALAQFKNLSDAAKLSQPAYSPMDAGLELSGKGLIFASGTAISCNVRYDLTIIDTKLRRFSRKFYVLLGSLFNHFLSGSSVARSSLSAYHRAQTQPFAEKVAVNPESFAVTLRANNQVYHPEAAAFTSQALASDYLARAVTKDPTLAGTIHVIPQFEVAA